MLVSSWVFSVCSEIASKAEEALISQSFTEDVSLVCRGAIAELLDVAKIQLEQIGMRSGHFPLRHPFAASASEPPLYVDEHLLSLREDKDLSVISPVAPISQQSITAALGNEESFDKIYSEYCRRCVNAYRLVKRRRNADRIQASLASFEQLRSKVEVAQQLYSEISPDYSTSSWRVIEARILQECCTLQGELDMGREELLSTLALMRAGMNQATKNWTLLDQEDRGIVPAQKLLNRIYKLSQGLEKGSF